MTSVFDILFTRRPCLNYVCPPVCEVLFSGSGSPVIILGDFPDLNSPGGVFFGGLGNFHLRWNRYPGALCYSVYRSDTPDGPLVLVEECVPDPDIPLPPGCYRVSAITLDGETTLSDAVCYFVPPMLPPEVMTEAASDILVTEATLNGTINAVGQASTAQFEWGLTLAYGNFTPLQDTGETFDDAPFSAGITGLMSGTLYHYRAIGSNGSGIGEGEDMTFVTNSPPAAFWDLTWSTYNETLNGGSTLSKALLPASFGILLETPPFGDANIEYNGAMQFTGPDKIGHLHIVVSGVTNPTEMFEVIRIFLDGNQIFFVFEGDLEVDGTYDYDFAIPASVNLPLEVYFNVANGGTGATALRWVATLTATDA